MSGPTQPCTQEHESHLAAFCGKMLNHGAQWLFKAQPANRKRPAPVGTAPTTTATDGSSGSSRNNDAYLPKPKRSRRTWQTPYTAVQLYKELLSGNFKQGRRTCCKKMRCVERFATGKYDNELLIQEQERMSKFVLETERKQFVQERCPLGPLQRGAMYAGLEPVCSNAFVWLFGVSTDLIAAVKGTPKARASSSIGRFGVAVKGRNIFTRSHLAATLRNSYDPLPVRCTTLENLGNFKELLLGAMCRVPRVSDYRAFRVRKEGAACVVEVKKAMHHEHWCGFSANGKEVGAGDGFSPHRMFYASSLRIESLPSYELKKVEPHTLHMLKQRYTASQSRMGAAFPGDVARIQALKDEQNQQILLLERKGHLPPDLPTDWLPDFVPESSNNPDDYEDNEEDDDDKDNDDIHSDHESSEDEDSEARATGRMQGSVPSRGSGGNGIGDDVAVGSFGFLLAAGAPFLVGKIDRGRIGEGGEREVCLHWFTPSARLVSQAACAEFEKYGRAVFSQTFNVEAVVLAGQGQRKKYVPDEGWEPVSRIVTTCRLLRKSKYIPGAVLKVLRNAKKASKTKRSKASGENQRGSE